ncbi:hypothetical protein [Vacuolonema iberomarrocanum]|uniref:hypothetical protein n=1 Tax=Vacuolonema iberomarrocanum TaxID=3454632 RepID=UPI0019DF2A48|nr:hypothetical protein [filamentous cyanobacterium LEGE 07170]
MNHLGSLQVAFGSIKLATAVNQRWAASGIQFSWSDMHRLHEAFWRRNTGMQVLAWAMEPDDTASLVERSRAEQVTVNSALWTTFLAVQYDSQGDRR